MQGFGIQSLKKNPALIPLYAFVGAGVAGAVIYLGRLALKNPDVTWNRSKNPEPWQEYKDKQYKFYSPNIDYSKIKTPAPNYED